MLKLLFMLLGALPELIKLIKSFASKDRQIKTPAVEPVLPPNLAKPQAPIKQAPAMPVDRAYEADDPQGRAPETPAFAIPPTWQVSKEGPYKGDQAAFESDLEKLKRIAETGES